MLVMLVCACNASSDVSRQLGARCDNHDQCDGLCLTGPTYPDGLCSLNCNTSSDCPGGAACVDTAQGVCLFTCSDNLECEFLGAGWTCAVSPQLPDGQVNVCIGT